MLFMLLEYHFRLSTKNVVGDVSFRFDKGFNTNITDKLLPWNIPGNNLILFATIGVSLVVVSDNYVVVSPSIVIGTLARCRF